MAISYEITVEQALSDVNFVDLHGALKEFILWEKEEFPGFGGGLSRVIDKYESVKDEILNIVNSQYSAKSGRQFRHKIFPLGDTSDELGCFLWEAGSNALSYSEFGAPYRVNLWRGKDGFIIGLEQKGEGFNAMVIDSSKYKTHFGGGFTAYREFENIVFFDNPGSVNVVFFKYVV